MGFYRGLNSIKDDKQSPENIACNGQKISLHYIEAGIYWHFAYGFIRYTDIHKLVSCLELCILSFVWIVCQIINEKCINMSHDISGE